MPSVIVTSTSEKKAETGEHESDLQHGFYHQKDTHLKLLLRHKGINSIVCL